MIKNPFTRLRFYFLKYQDRWFFTPLLGTIMLLIILLVIIGLQTLPLSSPTTDGPSPSPSPTASDSKFSDLINDLPEGAPTSSPTPKPTPSPKPSPSPTPTPTPSAAPTPTPTPVTNPRVQINNPVHQHNYDGNQIEINMEVITDQAVDKLEVLLNGSIKHTFTSSPFTTTLTGLSADSYQLQGRATLKSGDILESGILFFGLGGTSWDTPDSTESASLSHPPSST